MEYSMEMVAAQLRKPEGDMGIDIAKRMNASNVRMINKAIKTLNCQRGDIVVEIGAGNGITSTEVLNIIGATGKYVAIDYSADMLNLVEENLESLNFVNYRLINKSCLEVDEFLQANKVFASNLLYFIEDIPLLLDKVKKWCVSNTQIAFAVRSKQTMIQFPFTKHDFILRDKEDYFAEFKKAGVHINIDTFVDEDKTLDGMVINTDYHIIHAQV